MRVLTYSIFNLAKRLRIRVYGAGSVEKELGRRLAQATILTVIATVLLAIAVSQSLAGWKPVVITMAYSWAGLAGFFFLLRSEWSKRRADPTFSFEILVYGISAVVLSYGLLEIARGAALELLCLSLAFGMEELSTRQLLKASFYAVVMLALTSVVRIIVAPAEMQWQLEVYNLLMAAVLLPVAIIVGGEISRLYRRQSVQREQLSTTLNRLTELSVQDSLTGLTNRRRVLRLLEEVHAKATCFNERYSVAMLDIDWFKRVNDSHGHAVGDSVLRHFAGVMASGLDPRATLARWGGEEFLLLLPGYSSKRAQELLSACRKKMDTHDWSALVNGLVITFSAGVASYRPGSTTEDLLRCADRNLYTAKDNGRNRTEISTETSVFGESDSLPPQSAQRSDFCSWEPTDSRMPSVDNASVRTSESSRISHVDRRASDIPSSQRGRWSPLSDAVLSTSPDIRENLRLPLISVVLHGVWLSMVYFYALPQGQIPKLPGWTAITCDFFAVVGFYIAIRSGWSRRFSDGGLILAQMLSASTIASFGYAVSPALRPSILHLLCVIQVFGMVTLRPMQTRTAGICAVVLLGLVMGWLILVRPNDLNAEVLKLVLACAVITQLSLLSHSYSTMRERVQEDKLRLELAVAQTEEEVARDPLTGLTNRRHMEEILRRHQDAWRAGDANFCLALIDIDHFKRINDRKGHHVGDSVLIALAQASRQSLRESDVMCRWGGEEFVLLLLGGKVDSMVLASLQRLRDAFVHNLSMSSDIDYRVTFSCGISYPSVDTTIEELLAQADDALYRAKNNGRDQDIFYVSR